VILPCQQHLDMGGRSNFIDLPIAVGARTNIRDWGVAKNRAAADADLDLRPKSVRRSRSSHRPSRTARRT
jgi:hypothetical protein